LSYHCRISQVRDLRSRQGLREGEGRGQRLEDLRGEREAGTGVVTRAAPAGIRGAD
jgi:hypothetical protein